MGNTAWCEGCDKLLPPPNMGWEAGLYLCANCRGELSRPRIDHPCILELRTALQDYEANPDPSVGERLVRAVKAVLEEREALAMFARPLTRPLKRTP